MDVHKGRGTLVAQLDVRSAISVDRPNLIYSQPALNLPDNELGAAIVAQALRVSCSAVAMQTLKHLKAHESPVGPHGMIRSGALVQIGWRPEGIFFADRPLFAIAANKNGMRNTARTYPDE